MVAGRHRVSGIVVVVNPASGGGRAGEVWEELRRGEPRVAAARVVQTSDPEAAQAELARALDGGVDRLIVLGGDGSAHLVGNCLLELGRGADVAMGLVPLGTGVDLARTLGLPADPKAALARVLAAAARPMDVIELTTDDARRRFVLNVASAGISGPVDEAVNALHRPGKAAYLMATFGALRRYQPVLCRVVVDEQEWFTGKILVLAVANGCSFGRGMRIAPRARLDDGKADVVVVGAVPKWQLVLRMPELYRGTHLESRHVKWCQARSVRLEPLASLPAFDLDGDVFASGAASFRVLPGALRILA